MAEKLPITIYSPDLGDAVEDLCILELQEGDSIAVGVDAGGDAGQVQTSDGEDLQGSGVVYDPIFGFTGIEVTEPEVKLDLGEGEAAADNLGSLAGQSADNVDITGGVISGLDTPLEIESGGTDASDLQGALNNLTQVDSAQTMSVLQKVSGNAVFALLDAQAHTILDPDGAALPQREGLRFLDNLTAEDSSGADSTLVKFPSAAFSPAASTIPGAGISGTLDIGWFPEASAEQLGVVRLSPYTIGSKDYLSPANPSDTVAITDASVEGFVDDVPTEPNLVEIFVFS